MPIKRFEDGIQEEMKEFIVSRREQGKTWSEMARELNDGNLKNVLIDVSTLYNVAVRLGVKEKRKLVCNGKCLVCCYAKNV